MYFVSVGFHLPLEHDETLQKVTQGLELVSEYFVPIMGCS